MTIILAPCQTLNVDPDDWFAPAGTARAVTAAQLCRSCPFANDCAYTALTEGIPEGIWGGLDRQDRERIWALTGGRPSGFLDGIDAAMGPLLQARRDYESFDLEVSA